MRWKVIYKISRAFSLFEVANCRWINFLQDQDKGQTPLGVWYTLHTYLYQHIKVHGKVIWTNWARLLIRWKFAALQPVDELIVLQEDGERQTDLGELEKECVWYDYKSNVMGDFTFKVSSILPWCACTLQNDLNVSSSTKMCKAAWSGKRCVCLLLIVDVFVFLQDLQEGLTSKGQVKKKNLGPTILSKV